MTAVPNPVPPWTPPPCHNLQSFHVRFANYIHLMQQWPLLQPDPRKAGVLDGSVRHVSPKLPILKRPDVKQVSDEHGEAMHRRVLAQKHNQGGGKAHASAGTRERKFM